MDTETAERATAGPEPRRRLLRGTRADLVTGGVVLAVTLGVLVRLHARSALWLDEALSVDIARLPLSDLPAALRQDGAPPLYYVLLHVWTAAFGTGDAAVRALSTAFSLAALPLVWQAGRRLHSPVAGTTALLLLATNPFAVRYATETRMYALVVVLVLAGVLALTAALREPVIGRLAPVSGLAALLALTHYWCLFLLVVVAGGLAVAAVRAADPRPARRCLAALAAGGVLFLPWLPTFLFQSAHTGTPWATPPSWSAVVTTWTRWSGPSLPGAVLGLLLLGLTLAAPLARRHRDRDGAEGVLLRLPALRVPSLLSGAAVGTVLVGIAATVVQSSGYAVRYSSVALPLGLLAAATGAQALPVRARTVVVGLAVLLGLVGSLPLPFVDVRTQARVTAAAIAPRLAPGDLVLYCPDQLGPAVARLLPPATDQLVYPTGGGPRRVDWVDYAARNAAGDPRRFAAAATHRARGAVWLVSAAGYATYGDACSRLAAALRDRRGAPEHVLAPEHRFEERQAVLRFPGPA